MGSKSHASGFKVIVENRKARHNYHILETFEAGLVLTGMEIKSIRAGQISLGEAYVRPGTDGLYLVSANIRKYSHSAGVKDYDPVRPRKLLLHKREIDKLRGRVEAKGLTVVPLKVYLKRGYAKLEIALAQGKAAPDKRQAVKEREAKRQIARALKQSG